MKKNNGFQLQKPTSYLISHIEVARIKHRFLYYQSIQFPCIILDVYICFMNDSRMFTIVKSQKLGVH